MSRLVCALIGHGYRRSKLKSLSRRLFQDKFICLRCKENDNRPIATFYTPIDIPPPNGEAE
jgi:hypothetical protein